MPVLALTAWFLRKRFFILALLVSAVSASAFGQAAFFAIQATPYDHQMMRVGFTLASRGAEDTISAPVLNQWMTELRAIPYHYSTYWQTPAEVGDSQASDCKGKAVALYAKMRQNGATNLWLVIGKHHIYDTVTHAWLEWETTAGTFLLDPTFNEAPVRTAELDPMIYLPIYAYDGIRKYRVANAGFIVPSTRVASGVSYQSHVPLISPATSFTAASLSSASLRQELHPPLAMPSLTTSTWYLPLQSQRQQPAPPRAAGIRSQRSEVGHPPSLAAAARLDRLRRRGSRRDRDAEPD